MHSEHFLQKRKLLLYLPCFTLPWLVGGFMGLHGGQGGRPSRGAVVRDSGFNAVLPAASIHAGKAAANKADLYQRAEQDSAKWKTIRRQDPYLDREVDSMDGGMPSASGLSSRSDMRLPGMTQALGEMRPTRGLRSPAMTRPMGGLGATNGLQVPGVTRTPGGMPLRGMMPMTPQQRDALPEDERAGRLLAELDRLQHSLQQPVARTRMPEPELSPARSRGPVGVEAAPREPDKPDPELATLNGMLDKILRIQHPEEIATGSGGQTGSGLRGDGAEGDTMAAHALPAVVAADQVLVAGSTIALRLEGDAWIGRVLISRGQMVYGVVSMSNDRMMVRVNAIRKGEAIYATSLQVYDMDALPGIHIPGDLGRETAKQSADQSLQGVTITNVDPGLGAQAVNAGVQTAKNLLSRKVRTVRVGIRAGYHVLLRNEHGGGNLRVAETKKIASDSTALNLSCLACEPFMWKRERENGLQLVLTGIYLQKGSLYFLFRLTNEGPIAFKPDHVRWSIRDRKPIKRAAVQDREVIPVRQEMPVVVPGDSVRTMQFAFTPFALAKGKRLVLQVTDEFGMRMVELVVDPKDILHCKTL